MSRDDIMLIGTQETWVDRILHGLFGRPPTLDERVEEMLKHERALIEATNAAILRQQFDLHMSKSRIAALEDWKLQTQPRVT